MSVQELILPAGPDCSMRVRDDAQGRVEIITQAGMNKLVGKLDRGNQHLLLLFLEERLRR